MARHRDINKAHARFEGHGFHIEYHPESIKYNYPDNKEKPKKRNKRRCLYFNKQTTRCEKLKCICTTSSGCSTYRD